MALLAKVMMGTWARRSNPWASWIGLVGYPLMLVPIWYREWMMAMMMLMMIPMLFARVTTFDNWMSKAVVGRQMWLARPRFDLALLLLLLSVGLAVAAAYTAYSHRSVPMAGFAAAAWNCNLWYLRCMAAHFERSVG